MAFTDGRHILYDSLRTCSSLSKRKYKDYREDLIALPLDLQQQVAAYCKSADDIEIDVGRVHQQSNGKDCGVFAITFATHLAHGMNPEQVVFDDLKMREHLIQCFEKNVMTPFPTVYGKRGKFCSVEHLTLKIYCICLGIFHPEDPMVCCSKCDEWFHAKCVITCKKKRNRVLDPKSGKSILWYCHKCDTGE